MSSLREFQKELRSLLTHRASGTHVPLWKSGIPSRLGVYENNVQSNWKDALANDFPLTQKQFSKSEWETLQTAYFRKHPPLHWELNTSLAPFPKFINSQKLPSYIKELADWEWNDLQIFIHPATVRAAMGISNPTAIVRVYYHQIFDWVHQEAPSDRPPAQKPEVLIFYRDIKNVCHIREADPLMLLVLEHYKKRNAVLRELESSRSKLLPDNHIALSSVVQTLCKEGLLLL